MPSRPLRVPHALAIVILPLLPLTLAWSGTSPPPPARSTDGPVAPHAEAAPEAGLPETPSAPPTIDVVFVLDTTGSMSGLIEGAKQKIWSIANHIATAHPSPLLRIGLVAYRDRGDAYITRHTPLTDDLDAVYTDLMTYQATGGGDTPESVNQALHEAVTAFDWTDTPDSVRLIYLVGDAPPHMDYEDDVPYHESCRLAQSRGVIINTIQCGSIPGTRDIWMEIAQAGAGAFAAVPQDGGMQAIPTPHDAELATLDGELASLLIDYGDLPVLEAQQAKRSQGLAIRERAAPEAVADRACYNVTTAGEGNLYGMKELVSDVTTGRVRLEDVPQAHLPEHLRGRPIVEVRAVIEANNARRTEIRERVTVLAAQRAAFQAAAIRRSPADSFDRQVLESLRTQVAAIGLRLSDPGAPAPVAPLSEGP